MGRHIRASSDELDYNKQSLPKFAVWAGHNATAATAPTTYGLLAYDSDFSEISATMSSNFAGLTTAGGAAYAVAFQTSAALTATSTVGLQGWAGALPAQGYDGHTMISAAVDGSYAFRSRTLMDTAASNYGVSVGPEGWRANFAIYERGAAMQIAQYAPGPAIALDTLVLDGTMMNLFGLTAGTLGTTGSIGYNRNTNTLVVIEARDSVYQAYRAHIWRNPAVKLSGRIGQLRSFILGAYAAAKQGQSYRYVDFSFAAAPAVAANAESARLRPFVCNNGTIVLTRMLAGTAATGAGQQLAFVVPAADGSNNGTFFERGTLAAIGTTYGLGTAASYGLRHNVTWDNKWALSYSAYQGYGSGMNAYLINLDDPSTFYTVQIATAGGVQAVPYGRSGFVVNDGSVSATTNGLSLAILEASQGFTPGGVALTNMGAYPLTFTQGVVDTPVSGAAQFSVILPIERWAAPGVINGPL